MSDFFDVSMGLKQGEPLSPILFILFVNDINDALDINNLTDDDLDILSIYLLMFADDMVVFTTDKSSLQFQLNSLYEYTEKWGLKINVNKSKVCIFEKRKSNCNFDWTIAGEKLEIVDEFCYLGIKFFRTGRMQNAVNALNDQALKAMNSLLSLFKKVPTDIKTKLLLFDRMVSPILLYAAEAWGVYNLKSVDKIHMKFLKKILGVSPQTPNFAVYGELGRYPMSLLALEKSIKYYLKIKSNRMSLIHTIFNENCNIQIASRNAFNWSKKIKENLDKTGYSYIWTRYNIDNFNFVFKNIQRRLRDNFIQEWQNSTRTCVKLDYYCNYKTNFKFENYLRNIRDETLRKTLTRFRLASHKLAIETGRVQNIDRQDRLCRLCNINRIESEYHFLCVCPKYCELRSKYLNIHWFTIAKFNRIMSSKKRKIQLNTAKFIKRAFDLRNIFLNNA